jgi:hypothetical protein
MNKKINAIFINAEKGEITDIVMKNDLQAFCDLLDCKLLGCVNVNENNMIIFDEDGFSKNFDYGFSLSDEYSIYGNGIVVGFDKKTGEFKSVEKAKISKMFA